MLTFIKKHPLFFLILLGIVFRCALLFLDFSFDVNNHIAWAKDLHNRGFAGFYETPSSEVYATRYPNYPPLALFIFYVLYPLQSLVFRIGWWLNVIIPIFPSKLIFFIQSRVFLAATFKLASIAADVGLAWLTFLFVKKLAPKQKKLPHLAASFVLFNPAFFYNSAYWGQIDAIPLFFALTSFYLLLFTKRPVISGIFLTLALLVKPTILIFIPLYVVFFLKKNSFLDFFKVCLVSVTAFWLFFLPFFKSGNMVTLPFTTYVNRILATQSLPYVTNGAFNAWVLITGYAGIKDVAPFLFGISYRFWGYGIVGLFFIFILTHFARQKDRVASFFTAGFFCALVAFLFLTKMHERYSILPLPFLLIASAKKPSLIRWFIVLSFISFLNLYHSWPVPSIEILKTVITSVPINILLSTVNVFTLVYLSYRIMGIKHEY